MKTDNKVAYNRNNGYYEMPVEGLTVFARVRETGSILYIDYVEAPEPLRGTGAAGRFMDGLMEIARSKNLRVFPICGYAASWLKRHPEYQDLNADS